MYNEMFNRSEGVNKNQISKQIQERRVNGPQGRERPRKS